MPASGAGIKLVYRDTDLAKWITCERRLVKGYVVADAFQLVIMKPAYAPHAVRFDTVRLLRARGRICVAKGALDEIRTIVDSRQNNVDSIGKIRSDDSSVLCSCIGELVHTGVIS